MDATTKKRIGRYAGYLTGFVLVAILIWRTDISEIARNALSIRYRIVFPLLVTFCAQLLAVFAWYLSFLKLPPLSSVRYLYYIRLVGESLSQINPTNLVAGETLKALLLKKRLGHRYVEAAMSILLSRIMLFMGTGFLLVLTVGFMFQFTDSRLFKSVSIVLCLLVVACFIYIVHTLHCGHGVFRGIVPVFNRLFGSYKFGRKIVSLLSEIDRDMIAFYSRRRFSFYLVFAFSILHQVVGAMEFYIIFRILGIEVGFLSCLLFDVASMMIRGTGFFIPGQLGLEELANKLMFAVTSVPGNDTWLTVSIIRRARQIFWILTGFIVYLFLSHTEDIRHTMGEKN